MSKSALLIGIVYNGTSNQLNGCINDVVAMSERLKKTFGYSDVTVLTDFTPIKPTKKNIINEIQKLIEKSKNNKEIFFHYSGHGTREIDLSGDEKDGRDEALVPLDYQISGTLTDDELRELFSKSKCPVIIVLDCCHSGSAIDLIYNAKFSKGRIHKFQENKTTSSEQPILMLSGCLDEELSWDVYLKDQKKFMGALTSTFLRETEKYNLTMKTEEITIEQLLLLIYMSLIEKGYIQRPVISSNKPLNVGGIFMSKTNQYIPEKNSTIVTTVATKPPPRKRTGGGCVIQ